MGARDDVGLIEDPQEAARVGGDHGIGALAFRGRSAEVPFAQEGDRGEKAGRLGDPHPRPVGARPPRPPRSIYPASSECVIVPPLVASSSYTGVRSFGVVLGAVDA